MVVLIGQYIDKMKRGEKTASEQSWCGYGVKKTPLLETQHIHSRSGGDLPQTKIQYHQTSQAAEPEFYWSTQRQPHHQSPPQKGSQGCCPAFKACRQLCKCPFRCLCWCSPLPDSSTGFCFLQESGWSQNCPCSLTWLRFFLAALLLTLRVKSLVIFFFNFRDFLELFWIVSLLV